MYVPKPFAFPEGALAEMHDLTEEQVFGILVTPGDGASDPEAGLQAVHMRTTLRALVRQAVAFQIEITRIKGKRKLNQNRRPADRAGVLQASLEASERGGDLAIAAAMRAL